MSHDHLAGIRSKLERANKHVADLDDAVRSFLNSKPYTVGRKHDPNTRKLTYYIEGIVDTCADIPQIVGDAISNLASALDHLAYRLFKKGGSSGDERKIYFPITNKTTLDAHKTARRGKVEGIPAPAIDALDSLEPYKGGKGNEFWTLSELNNLSKHRDLITVGGMFRNFDVTPSIDAIMLKGFGNIFPGMDMPNFPQLGLIVMPPARCPLKVGDEPLADAPQHEFDSDIDFAFDVAIHEPGFVEGKSLVKAVDHFRTLVRKTVELFVPHL